MTSKERYYKHREYFDEYGKKNYKQFVLRVRYDDEEVFEKLSSVDNRTKYIRDLIKADLMREKSVSVAKS